MDAGDDSLRVAAFARCAELVRGHQGAVPWKAIQEGFQWRGERVFLGATPRGIHRPTQMRRGVLSIKTTKPKPGREARYDDQVGGPGLFAYAFQGDDPGNRDNTALREAHDDGTPLIYFYGLVPGVYQIIFPCYVDTWDANELRCLVAVGSQTDRRQSAEAGPMAAFERAYTTALAKTRLHQATFRQHVLDAYGNRCAVTGLPIVKLLDAAHIIPDRDERGLPVVTNGLCLSKLHHTAFDQDLLGIDPDGIVHVADAVLAETDGPTLEAAIKAFHGKRIRFPHDAASHPDRDYLAVRFEAFRKVG